MGRQGDSARCTCMGHCPWYVSYARGGLEETPWSALRSTSLALLLAVPDMQRRRLAGTVWVPAVGMFMDCMLCIRRLPLHHLVMRKADGAVWCSSVARKSTGRPTDRQHSLLPFPFSYM